MGIYRLYATKNNSIASGSAFELLNSSQNPVTDLWYGGTTSSRNSISRHLVYFDLTDFQSKLNSKEINEDYITSYKLKFKNSIPADRVLDPEYEFNTLSKKVASSFDLIVFPINKDWDEGRGFDLDEQHYIVKSKTCSPSLTGYSNWISATSTVDWDEPGIYTNPTASTSSVTQHFSLGSEDINVDISTFVNDWLSGGSENYGLAIAYSRPFELTSADTRNICSFYTNKTNTAFKPYIEVQYNQVINDDRHKVANNRRSRLFLYLFSGNTAVNYYSAGTVSIKTNAGADVYTGLVPTNHSKGVYYVDVTMSGTSKGQKYKDVWNDITFTPGLDVQAYTQTFVIQGNYYTNSSAELNDYTVSTYGLENNEALIPGEIVRIYADARINYSSQRPSTNFGLEYKLTMNSVDEIIPWTSINTSIINGCEKYYFDIDTSWLLDNQTYEINLRINEFGAKKILSERINFKVIDNFSKVNL